MVMSRASLAITCNRDGIIRQVMIETCRSSVCISREVNTPNAINCHEVNAKLVPSRRLSGILISLSLVS